MKNKYKQQSKVDIKEGLDEHYDARSYSPVKHRIALGLKLGIKYMPCLIYGKVNPEAYRIWEDIDGRWDSNGVWGVSIHEIDYFWYISGCRDCQKYRILLKKLSNLCEKRFDNINYKNFKKSHSVQQIKYLFRGMRFFINRDFRFAFSNLSIKVLIFIGKMSLPVRYALLRDIDFLSGMVRIRDLNLELASKVQKMTKEEQCEFLTTKERWYHLFGRCPFYNGQDNYAPPCPIILKKNKSVKLFIELCKEFGTSSEMILPIFNLCSIFQNRCELERFIGAKIVPASKKIIHDAGQFNPPQNPSKTLKDMTLKYGKEVLKFSRLWERIEKEFGRPKSLKELRNYAGAFFYDSVTSETRELAQLCYSLRLDEEGFEKYVKQIPKVKNAESIPYAESRFGDYFMYKLDYDDPRGLLLGLYTDCCQHLEGAGRACAKHGWKRADGAFFVVEHKGNIIAQSWAWRVDDNVVFDSIESLDGYNVDIIAELYKNIASQIVNRLLIKSVFVGRTTSGITNKIYNTICDTEDVFALSPSDYNKYYDGREQLEIKFKAKL